MTRKTPEAAAAAAPATQTELTVMLLDVLRGVNRAAQDTRTALDGDVQAAINHFRQIDLDLQVLAEETIDPDNSFNNGAARA
jgi:hypothetical protein